MRLIRTALITLALFAAGHASAQNYPDRSIRILVGFTPGSATDITARIFAQKLNEAWNVTVTVENVAGAGGSVGGERVGHAAPDGYTLYWGANGAMTINPSLQTNPTFDPQRDLTPVARLLVAPSILAVSNDVPAKTVAELVALAKAQPGKLSCASPGTGTPQHIACEVLKNLAGIDIVHVPYRGANFTDVIGGPVTMTFQNAGAILPTVHENKLRGLAMTARTRSQNMPEIPTMIEAGVKDFEVTSWFGLLAPAGTPAPVIAKLHQEAVRIVLQPALREKFGANRARCRQRSARRFRRDHQDGHRQMGEGDQGRRHQGGRVTLAARRPSPPLAAYSMIGMCGLAVRGRTPVSLGSSQTSISRRNARKPERT